MAKIGRWGLALVFGVGVALASSSARADYVVSVVESGGGSALVVLPGDTVDLGVSLVSNAGDIHDSMVLDVVFSEPGLLYNSYLLDPVAYNTGDLWITDYSVPNMNPDPLHAALLLVAPHAINADSYLAPGNPGLLDIHFEAGTKVAGTTFGEGMLLTFVLEVPTGYPMGPVLIDAAPVLFGLTPFDEICGVPGQTFTLEVIPEPATLALLALGGVAVLRRRRK